MEKKKEKWGKPKLIILARGKPEEAVLHNCAWGAKAPNKAQTAFQCYGNPSCQSCFTSDPS
jgi:hypothetical protein